MIGSDSTLRGLGGLVDYVQDRLGDRRLVPHTVELQCGLDDGFLLLIGGRGCLLSDFFLFKNLSLDGLDCGLELRPVFFFPAAEGISHLIQVFPKAIVGNRPHLRTAEKRF